VVAVRREHRLADKASHIFTKSFYNALLLSKSVQTAFDIAVRFVPLWYMYIFISFWTIFSSLFLDPSLHSSCFSLQLYLTFLSLFSVSTVSAIHGSNCGDEFILLPLNGNHSECVFDSSSVGGVVSEQRVQTVNFCDCPPSNFIERCRVMQEMYRHFVDHHRCVTLHGLKGKNHSMPHSSLFAEVEKLFSILTLFRVLFFLFFVYCHFCFFLLLLYMYIKKSDLCQYDSRRF
jgi:hypothetical protein